jgi:hypothetical protein
MYSHTARIVALVVLIVGAAAAVGGQSKKVADIGGTWTLALTFDKGKDTLVLSVQQKGEEIAGTLSSKAFGERKVSGRAADGRVTLNVDAERHGRASTLKFSGRLDGAGAMAGTSTWRGEKAAFGRWTATKKQ